MKKNMGSADRILRILVAIAVAILYYTNVISGNSAIVLGVVAVVFVVTSFLSFCPLYLPFGISTHRKKVK